MAEFVIRCKQTYQNSLCCPASGGCLDMRLPPEWPHRPSHAAGVRGSLPEHDDVGAGSGREVDGARVLGVRDDGVALVQQQHHANLHMK